MKIKDDKEDILGNKDEFIKYLTELSKKMPTEHPFKIQVVSGSEIQKVLNELKNKK